MTYVNGSHRLHVRMDHGTGYVRLGMVPGAGATAQTADGTYAVTVVEGEPLR